MKTTRPQHKTARPRATATAQPGRFMPFFYQPACAGHDLLVLNPRADLTPDEIPSTTEFLRNCFAGFQI